MQPEEFPIKRYSIKELSNLYRCDRKTFRRWLQAIKSDLGQRTGHFYSTMQVKKIVDHLGTPFYIFMAAFIRSFADDLDYGTLHHGTNDTPDASDGQAPYDYDEIQRDPWRNWRR